MEFTADTTYLKDAAAWAALALAPGRGIDPVYATIRVTASGNGLTLAAFDGERAATCLIPARVDEPGTVMLSGRLLVSLVAKMPPGLPLTVTARGDGRARVEASSPKLRTAIDLEVLSGDNYPVLPELPPIAGAADGMLFAAAVSAVAGAVAGDSDPAPAEGLRGLRIEPGPEALTVVGCNGIILGVRRIPWSRAAEGVPALLLPPKVVEAATRAIPAGAKVTLHAGPGDEADPRGMAGLSCDDRTLFTRVRVAPYPGYARMLRAEDAFTATMDTGALLGAVERAELVMERDAGVTITFCGAEATVEAAGGPNGASETIDVTCDARPSPARIVLNPGYLREAVRASDPDRVQIGFTPPFSAVRITAAGNGTVTDCDCYLLQPLKRPEPAGAAG